MVETYVHKERAISRFIPTDSGSAVTGFCGDNTQATQPERATQIYSANFLFYFQCQVKTIKKNICAFFEIGFFVAWFFFALRL